MLRHAVRLVAATIAVAATGVVVPAPAHASTCSTASGVSVVVDFHQLGGGVSTFCDAGGAGEYADAQFTDAGHALTYVHGEAFVCQVDGVPQSQCAQTPPQDAYWSLWWSDGKSGTWQYASVGVSSLKVPDGGYVALSWQGQSSQAKPRVAPTAHGTSSPSSSPSTRPTSKPSGGSHPSGSPGSGPSTTAAADPGSTATPGSLPTSASRAGVGHGKRHHDRSSKGPKAHRPHGADGTVAAGSVAQVAAASDGSNGSGGLPGWVAPVAIAALFAGTGAVLLLRRRSGG